jgi:hypothetical protein
MEKYNYFIIILIIILIVYEYNVNFFNYYYIYEKNIYTNKEFNNILSICNTISSDNMILDVKATNRLMYLFKEDDEKTELLQSLLFNKKFIKKIRKLTGNYDLYPCLKVPIEYRKYSRGSYMNWHRDTKILKNQYQYECVLTLTNNSDSLTLMDNMLYNDEISTEPNSLMIVRAHGIRHMVTETQNGERTILKFVFYEKIK